ncbi:MAG: hypothetical protein AAF570_21025 [Bacteroidota bacterium]
MKALAEILRSKRFQGAVAGIFVLQFLCLLLTTPMYEIDTNSFIRGGFSWDIFHNPLLNLVIAVCTKIWPNVWFIVSVQLLIYAFCAALLVHVLLGKYNRLWLAGLLLAALEPVTMFYNFSLLAECFFTALTMLSVALLILWLRAPTPKGAVLFGLAMGLCFMSKLSAMIHLPLFGMLLLRQGTSLITRFKSLGLSLLPFAACYLFVFFGQKIINGGDIYTVEGRVRWDFSSAMYNSAEIDAPEFKRLVEPYILRDGKLVDHRELRRELSYLGYKDCVAEFERRGIPANKGINACDSLFGAVAQQIMDAHFWAAEKQFVADNFHFLHTLSYLDYRFTPGLHYYHPNHEYQYIDSLMTVHYGFNMAERADRIPRIWKSLDFGNVYLPIWWYLWWMALLLSLIWYLKDRTRWELLVLAGLTAIPLLFHLVYISYRARFLAPYLVLVGLLMLVLGKIWLERQAHKRPGNTALRDGG